MAPFRVTDLVPTFGLFGTNDGGDPHLLGQHTVRRSPISTAQLNPYAEAFCLETSGSTVLVPILLNNTAPIGIRYTLLPLGHGESQDTIGKAETHDLNTKDIRAIEQSRQESLELTRTKANKRDVNDPDYDEYDDDEEEDVTESSTNSLQKSQTLVYARITKPGTLRLERVLDTADVDARLVYPLEVVVAPCPKAEFVPDDISRGDHIKCAAPGVVSGHKGSTPGEDVNFTLDVFGVPPLSLRWYEDINGRREYFTVEGIVGDQTRGISEVPQKLQIPLTVSLGAIGRHAYTLEQVMDRYGNSITPVPGLTTARTITVLRRPSVSFKTCGHGRPSSLLIGSETRVAITTHSSDPLDGVWDVGVRYTPSDKKYKNWEKQLKSQDSTKDIILRASAPGEYTILGVKGKYCEGDVLSPETCKVIEMPFPSAEIEWKKIHEW
jgi:nucleoporin POM152